VFKSWPQLAGEIAHAGLLYLDHIQERGCDLFAAACARDLEGIVAKWAAGTYQRENDVAERKRLATEITNLTAAVAMGGTSNRHARSCSTS